MWRATWKPLSWAPAMPAASRHAIRMGCGRKRRMRAPCVVRSIKPRHECRDTLGVFVVCGAERSAHQLLLGADADERARDEDQQGDRQTHPRAEREVAREQLSEHRGVNGVTYPEIRPRGDELMALDDA